MDDCPSKYTYFPVHVPIAVSTELGRSKDPRAAAEIILRRRRRVQMEFTADDDEPERGTLESKEPELQALPVQQQPVVVDRVYQAYRGKGQLLDYLDAIYTTNFKTLHRVLVGKAETWTSKQFSGARLDLTLLIKNNMRAIFKALQNLKPGGHDGLIGMELLATLCLATRHIGDIGHLTWMVEQIATFTAKSPGVFDSCGLLSVEAKTSLDDQSMDVSEDRDIASVLVRRIGRLIDPVDTVAMAREIQGDSTLLRIGNSPWHLFLDGIRESWDQRLKRTFPWEVALRIYIHRLRLTTDERKRLIRAYDGLEEKNAPAPRNSDWRDAIHAVSHLADIRRTRIDQSEEGDMEDLAKCAVEIMDISTVFGSFPWRARFAPPPKYPDGFAHVLSETSIFITYLVDVVDGVEVFDVETALRAAICTILYGYSELDSFHYSDVPPAGKGEEQKEAPIPMAQRVFLDFVVRSKTPKISGLWNLFMFLCGDTLSCKDLRLFDQKHPRDTLTISVLRMRLAALMLPMTEDPARPKIDKSQWTKWPLNGWAQAYLDAREREAETDALMKEVTEINERITKRQQSEAEESKSKKPKTEED